MSMIGAYICNKFRSHARECGYESAARRLRKQAIPIEIALSILIYAGT